MRAAPSSSPTGDDRIVDDGARAVSVGGGRAFKRRRDAGRTDPRERVVRPQSRRQPAAAVWASPTRTTTMLGADDDRPRRGRRRHAARCRLGRVRQHVTANASCSLVKLRDDNRPVGPEDRRHVTTALLRISRERRRLPTCSCGKTNWLPRRGGSHAHGARTADSWTVWLGHNAIQRRASSNVLRRASKCTERLFEQPHHVRGAQSLAFALPTRRLKRLGLHTNLIRDRSDAGGACRTRGSTLISLHNNYLRSARGVRDRLLRESVRKRRGRARDPLRFPRPTGTTAASRGAAGGRGTFATPCTRAHAEERPLASLFFFWFPLYKHVPERVAGATVWRGLPSAPSETTRGASGNRRDVHPPDAFADVRAAVRRVPQPHHHVRRPSRRRRRRRAVAHGRRVPGPSASGRAARRLAVTPRNSTRRQRGCARSSGPSCRGAQMVNRRYHRRRRTGARGLTEHVGARGAPHARRRRRAARLQQPGCTGDAARRRALRSASCATTCSRPPATCGAPRRGRGVRRVRGAAALFPGGGRAPSAPSGGADAARACDVEGRRW